MRRRNLRHEADRVPNGPVPGAPSDHGGNRCWHSRILFTFPCASPMQCSSLLAFGCRVTVNVVEKVDTFDAPAGTVCVAVVVAGVLWGAPPVDATVGTLSAGEPTV